MSDAMMFGIAKMPYEMAMSDEMSRRQFYANTQRLVAALEAARAEVERLREALEDIRSRSLIDLVMRSDRLELIALLGDIYQIADSEL